MAYTPGTQANIIVGAAAVFVNKTANANLPAAIATESYATTLSGTTPSADWRNIGFTSNGLELQFQPEFGEVQVDQVLDAAKMFKSGMQVTLNTSMAEATLENLLFAIAAPTSDLDTTPGDTTQIIGGSVGSFWVGADAILDLSAGSLGDCPVERKLVAVGSAGGDCAGTDVKERVYVAYRVLSIDSVTVSAKRDEASVFDVSFRLLPDGSNGLYGQIVDRTYTPA